LSERIVGELEVGHAAQVVAFHRVANEDAVGFRLEELIGLTVAVVNAPVEFRGASVVDLEEVRGAALGWNRQLVVF